MKWINSCWLLVVGCSQAQVLTKIYQLTTNNNLILIIFTACAAACSQPPVEQSLTVNKNDPSLKQLGKYLYYKETPFTGAVEERFDNGDLLRRTNYNNGLEDGKSETWYPNQKIESVRTYLNGEKNGVHRGWWPNGNLQYEYEFDDGLYHGTFREWYEDGKPLHLFVYDHGKEVSARGWRENGRTYINFVVLNEKKYGLTNARLCYSLQDEKGIYQNTNP